MVGIWRAKLSKKIAIGVFASIVVIELGIFVPSFWREKREQIDQVAVLSETAMGALGSRESGEGAMDEMGSMMASPLEQPKILAKLEENLEANPNLLGIAIYGLDGQMLGEIGDRPALRWEKQWSLQSQDGSSAGGDRRFYHELSSDWSRLDIAWPSSQEQPYTVVMRHNFTRSRTALHWFAARIAGLVLIISVFVTGVTIVVVYWTTVGPVLTLRRELEKVAASLANPDQAAGVLCPVGDRTDELGDVQRAFNTMYQTIHQEIASRRQAERQSDELLRNILPVMIAERLKQGERTIAERFEDATVLFADLVGFTTLAAQLPPRELVEILNQVFSRFDQLADRYDLEKIKTIGDAYMVVGGVPMTHCSCGITAIAEMALSMLDVLEDINNELNLDLKLRIGIHHGPVIAGVIGLRKFIYDLWGDTVNVASRMESHGGENRIHTTDVVYQALGDRYAFEKRGTIPIKGRGEMKTYWLLKRTGPAPEMLSTLQSRSSNADVSDNRCSDTNTINSDKANSNPHSGSPNPAPAAKALQRSESALNAVSARREQP
ncbi:MAG: adenylate/guanylate cyclase domain-containing protein [Cyanophyceae cyanobacterium]